MAGTVLKECHLAQEVFQKRMSQLLGDLQGVETDIDDILVWGSNQEEHNICLMAVLDRCEKINLTLNQEKCQLSVPRVSYIGHILYKCGWCATGSRKSQSHSRDATTYR